MTTLNGMYYRNPVFACNRQELVRAHLSPATYVLKQYGFWEKFQRIA